MAERTVQTELEMLEIEERRLRLELMKEQVAAMQSRKDQQARNRRDQAKTEEFNRRKVANEQAACSHKKGGIGIEGVFKGGAAEYSVVKHTEPWGETYVKCQRCGKEARDPFFMMRKRNPERVGAYRKANKREYEKTMREYTEWMNLPTDNSPSGGTIFGIQRDVDYEAAAV
jgi:hypothetical protein